MGFKLYTEEFKQKVVEAYKSGMKMSVVAEMFGVSTSAVSSWSSGTKKKDRRLMFSVEQKKEFVKYRIQHNISHEDMAKQIGVVKDTLKTGKTITSMKLWKRSREKTADSRRKRDLEKQTGLM